MASEARTLPALTFLRGTCCRHGSRVKQPGAPLLDGCTPRHVDKSWDAFRIEMDAPGLIEGPG